jgi:hypothetical protein
MLQINLYDLDLDYKYYRSELNHLLDSNINLNEDKKL